MKEWECEECGYTVVAYRPPARCPECESPRESFFILEEDEDLDYAELDGYIDVDADWLDDDEDDDDF